VFGDPAGPDGLSAVGRHAIGGVLAHARAPPLSGERISSHIGHTGAGQAGPTPDRGRKPAKSGG
jgi:hypothetical protein